MTVEDPRIAETDAIVAELERTGLLTVTTCDDGEPVYKLTSKGEQVSWQMANGDEDDALVLLDALLEESADGSYRDKS